MEYFAKIVKTFQRTTILAKSSTLDAWRRSGCASALQPVQVLILLEPTNDHGLYSIFILVFIINFKQVLFYRGFATKKSLFKVIGQVLEEPVEFVKKKYRHLNVFL